MMEKIRNLKNKKGFTLVELIVVLVILAILAALLIPSLTGYIDKANKDSVVAETRSAVMAAQTIASENYLTTPAATALTDTQIAEAKTLAEVKGTISDVVLEGGKVKSLKYTGTSYNCTYTLAGGYGDPVKNA